MSEARRKSKAVVEALQVTNTRPSIGQKSVLFFSSCCSTRNVEDGTGLFSPPSRDNRHPVTQDTPIRDKSAGLLSHKPRSLCAQTLQGELRNSEAKGSGLERQVSQLSARMNRVSSSSVGAGGGGGGGGDGADSRVAGSSGAGRESGDGSGGKARGAEVTEAEIASLRRQMKAAAQVCFPFFFVVMGLCSGDFSGLVSSPKHRVQRGLL